MRKKNGYSPFCKQMSTSARVHFYVLERQIGPACSYVHRHWIASLEALFDHIRREILRLRFNPIHS